MRKVLLGIFLFFIIALLFSNRPLRAQSPSCTITISPETGYPNQTTFSASGNIDIPSNRKVSRIDIVDETRTTVIRSLGLSTLNKDSFSIDEFGPFLKEGKYHLNLFVTAFKGYPLLCSSNTIGIVSPPTPTPGGPSITPTVPYTCNPPGRDPKNPSVCADPNCKPIGAVRNVSVNSSCEPFGVIAPTPIPTESPSPLSPCSQWALLDGTTISPKDPKYNDSDFKERKCVAVNTAIGNISTEPQGFVRSIFSIVLGLAGGIALILIMLSGYRMMASQGNPEALTASREQLISAIIGLLFIIFSFVILQVIGVDLLRIPGFKP